MTSDILICLGALTGGMAGGLTGWVVSRHRSVEDDARSVAADVVASDEPDGIDEIAQQWAAQHGLPDASDLVARKLRLASQLQTRRQQGEKWRT